MKIAIPTNAPGGLDAERSGHFGHCDMFTIVELSPAQQITNVTIVANEGHEAGGCLAPVSLLHSQGVEAIVVAGLGKRPMMGFNEVGITVYYADQQQVPDVRTVVERLRAGGLVAMHPEQVCQGSGNCHH